jgi:hypothetical protein
MSITTYYRHGGVLGTSVNRKLARHPIELVSCPTSALDIEYLMRKLADYTEYVSEPVTSNARVKENAEKQQV